MVKRRSLAGWWMCLLVMFSATPLLADGQEPSLLPQPNVLPQDPAAPQVSRSVEFNTPPGNSHLGAMPEGTIVEVDSGAVPLPPATSHGDIHTNLKRFWQFITFRQPPRPRQCQGCLGSPSSNCTATVFEFFSNRYPESSYSIVGK